LVPQSRVSALLVFLCLCCTCGGAPDHPHRLRFDEDHLLAEWDRVVAQGSTHMDLEELESVKTNMRLTLDSLNDVGGGLTLSRNGTFSYVGPVTDDAGAYFVGPLEGSWQYSECNLLLQFMRSSGGRLGLPFSRTLQGDNGGFKSAQPWLWGMSVRLTPEPER
jgi:hypothetical protein